MVGLGTVGLRCWWDTQIERPRGGKGSVGTKEEGAGASDPDIGGGS